MLFQGINMCVDKIKFTLCNFKQSHYLIDFYEIINI